MTDEKLSAPPQIAEEDQTVEFKKAFIEKDGMAIDASLDEMTGSDKVRAILQLKPEEREQVLTLAGPGHVANIIKEMPDASAAELISHLDRADAVEILAHLQSDVQADIIGEMDEKAVKPILDLMSPREARQLRRLLAYPSDTAGGLMVIEAFTVGDDENVGSVLRQLGSEEEDFTRYRGQFYPYVIDADGVLLGVLSILKMLGANRGAPVTEMMTAAVTVPSDTKLDDLADTFSRYSFFNLPVVDERGVLLGIVFRTAIDGVLYENLSAENRKLQGIVQEELRSMPLTFRARHRLSWLSINIGLNIMAAAVISSYEETLNAMIAIAVFLPMVSDMSGCTGSQAVAVSMRELSLGIVKPIDILVVWRKELAVGVINGIALGALIGLVAWWWKDNVYLGVVIGTALAANSVLAVSIGGTLPLLLKRFGIDPAVASGPLLTTVTDMVGFFLVLSLATAMMPLLIAP